MFRRTLLLFAGFVLLVLGLTVGYALLGLSGPRSALADADRAFEANRLTDTVRLLDLAERTLTAREHAELQPAILRRRFKAHRRLGNVKAARHDLDALLALLDDAPIDPRLRIERAELLLLDDAPDEALREVELLLAQGSGPERSRILELAGETHQKLYQRGLAKLVETIERALPGQARQRALDLLKSLLYRAPTDPAGVHARERLVKQLREEPATPIAVDDWLLQLRRVQAGIATSLDWFRQCLECDGGKPTAAYRGLLFALQQEGRRDDAEALTRLYLERFKHPGTVSAAIALAQDLFAARQFAQVVQVAEPYLPTGLLAERAAAGSFGPQHRQLMVTMARALRELNEAARLNQLATDCTQIWEQKSAPILPELRVIGMLQGLVHKAFEWPHKSIAWFLDDQNAKAITAPDYDLFAIGAELALDILEADQGTSAEFDRVFEVWTQARPQSRRPRELRVAHLLSLGRLEAALAGAQELLARDDRSEADLRSYAELADQVAAKTERDAKSVLRQALLRPSNAALELTDPAVYLVLGELALAKGAPAIALRAGQLAGRSFGWAEWPRRLQVQSAAALDRPDEALHLAEIYRKLHPRSQDAMQTYRAALAKAGRQDPSLQFEVALSGTPDPDLARTLIDSAVARDQRPLLAPLCQRSLFRYGSDPGVALSAAKGLLAAGETARARDLLLQIPATFPTERKVCIEAASRFLALEAKQHPNSPLLSVATETLLLHAKGEAETLLAVAGELERSGQTRLASTLIAGMLEPGADRGPLPGAVFALAGRLSLAAEDETKAEEHFTAASALKGGEDVALPLALVWLRQGRFRDARSALWQTEAKDPTVATLMLSLEQTEPALRWARERVLASPLDVIPALILAIAGNADDRRVIPVEYHNLVRTDRPGTLATITQLSMPGFATIAERSAKQLRQLVPKNPIAWFLHARALAQRGQLDAAIAELAELVNKSPSFLPAYDEVLRITDGGLHPDIGKLGANLSNSVLLAPNLATPRMVTMAGHALATHLSASGQDPAGALELLTHLWMRFPAETSANIENVMTLAARGRTRDAFQLLARIEPQIPATRRSQFLDFYFRLGQQIVRTGDAKLRAELDAKARQVLAEEGAFGAAVHYLVDALEEERGPLLVDGEPAPHAEQIRSLLLQHLEFLPSRRELSPAVGAKTIRRLASISSAAVTAEAIDLLLRRDATQLAVWLERARLHEARGDLAQAVASLRWILDYVADEASLLELVRLVGEHDLLDEAARKRLRDEFSSELAQRPDTAYPLGLLALRDGNLAEAARLLDGCANRSDGSHLYFRAHTALRQNEFDKARAAFSQLAGSYPKSPYQRMAQHFAAQLACAAAAPPHDGR